MPKKTYLRPLSLISAGGARFAITYWIRVGLKIFVLALERSDTQKVLDGDLDEFIEASLKAGLEAGAKRADA